MSDQQHDFLGQLKKISELEKERKAFEDRAKNATLELGLARSNLESVQNRLTAVVPLGPGESVDRLLQRVLDRMAQAEETVGEIRAAVATQEALKSRWRQLVEVALRSVGEVNEQNAEAKMALAVRCADRLLEEEQRRYGAPPTVETPKG